MYEKLKKLIVKLKLFKLQQTSLSRSRGPGKFRRPETLAGVRKRAPPSIVVKLRGQVRASESRRDGRARKSLTLRRRNNAYRQRKIRGTRRRGKAARARRPDWAPSVRSWFLNDCANAADPGRWGQPMNEPGQAVQQVSRAATTGNGVYIIPRAIVTL